MKMCEKAITCCFCLWDVPLHRLGKHNVWLRSFAIRNKPTRTQSWLHKPVSTSELPSDGIRIIRYFMNKWNFFQNCALKRMSFILDRRGLKRSNTFMCTNTNGIGFTTHVISDTRRILVSSLIVLHDACTFTTFSTSNVCFFCI